jgi:hypothetical protein
MHESRFSLWNLESITLEIDLSLRDLCGIDISWVLITQIRSMGH